MKIKDISSLMEKSKAVYLSTINSEGYPEIRALLNLANKKNYPKLVGKSYSVNDETLTIYFTTNTSSRKIAQIRNNNKVSLYFCEPEKFFGAGLTGTVEEITNLEIKKSFWQTGWRIYYHNGPTDKDYALCKFTSKSIHCWGSLGAHNFGQALATEKTEEIKKDEE